MKILYIITQADFGGAQKYIFDLATSEQARNHEIIVAAGQSDDQTLINKLKEKNIKTKTLKYLVREINPIKDFRAAKEIKNLYQQIKPDVIHLNSTKAGILGSLAKNKQNKAKLIYTAHGWVFNEELSKIKKTLFIWLEKTTAIKKDKIICVSQYDTKVATDKKISPLSKLITIHNGVNTDKLEFLTTEESRQQLGLPADSIIIGAIANFYKTKGLNYLIEATRLLVDKNPNIITVIIGDGELRDELTNLIKNYDLSRHFLLLGKKEKAHRYLPAFNIYACSSVKEGFPYSILEAMAATRPIVATKVGGIPEIITDQKDGLIIEPKNASQLASAIKYLADNKDYAENIAKNARQKVVKNFILKSMIEKTFNLYE